MIVMSRIVEDFILEFPKWNGEIVFAYEVVNLLMVTLALITGVLLCFWGYRYLQTLVLILLGCGCGSIGYRIAQYMTPVLVLQMCIFVMFTFLGICMLYFLSIVVSKVFSTMKLQSLGQRTLHILTALTGAVATGIIIYTKVLHNVLVAAGVTVVLAVLGVWYGSHSIKAQRVFRTYEDICKRKPLTEEKANA